jgi:hypothetical protein
MVRSIATEKRTSAAVDRHAGPGIFTGQGNETHVSHPASDDRGHDTTSEEEDSNAEVHGRVCDDGWPYGSLLDSESAEDESLNPALTAFAMDQLRCV